MLGGKSAAQVQPTAFSVMLQANSYGVVIPVIYGLAKSPMYGIWMNHLRKGQSDKKGKKAEKKGKVPAYNVNADLLIGTNPILGVYQAWNNNEPRYRLDMTGEQTTVLGAFASPSLPISDSHFYGVIAVTIDQSYDVTFNDYGGSGSQHLTGTFEVPLVNS